MTTKRAENESLRMYCRAIRSSSGVHSAVLERRKLLFFN